MAAPNCIREQKGLDDTIIRLVEVHVPPVVHDVPLKAVERWLRSPSNEAAARGVAAFREQGWAADALTATAVLRASPKEAAVKTAAAARVREHERS